MEIIIAGLLGEPAGPGIGWPDGGTSVLPGTIG